MNLPHPDTTDALLEEHFGSGATTEPAIMTGADWRDYARRLEADNKQLIETSKKWLDQRDEAENKLRNAEEGLRGLRVLARRLQGERQRLFIYGLFAGCLFSLFVVWVAVSL